MLRSAPASPVPVVTENCRNSSSLALSSSDEQSILPNSVILQNVAGNGAEINEKFINLQAVVNTAVENACKLKSNDCDQQEKKIESLAGFIFLLIFFKTFFVINFFSNLELLKHRPDFIND